jgi:cell division septum initiation protein DivIVA
MQGDLISKARDLPLWRGAVEELASGLPPEAEALRALLDGTVAARDDHAFVLLVLAALHAGRSVPADLLVAGAALFPDPGFMTTAAWGMSGNVADALVKAVERGAMGGERESAALLLAALWCRERNHQESLPSVLIQARSLARNPFIDQGVALTLLGVADIIKDEGLRATLTARKGKLSAALAHSNAECLLDLARRPVLDLVPAEQPPISLSGYTVRRAVPRISRNEPCPCGSGKKYKRCCFDKDQARLAQSSSVTGLTISELRGQREQYLTRPELLQMRSYDLVRLDPAKVNRDLLPILVNRLIAFNETERVVQLFETTGVVPPIDGHWYDAISHAAYQRQTEFLRRLAQLKPVLDPADPHLTFDVRLQLAESASSPYLDLIESEALAALKDQRFDRLVGLGFALLNSSQSALGILVTRGIVPIVTALDSEALMDALLDARDRLNLGFGDPIEAVVERHVNESWDPRLGESEELAAARRSMDQKQEETRRLREELARLKTDLQRSETPKSSPAPAAGPSPGAEASSPSAATAPPAALDDPASRALRQRMERLREELKQRHAERNQLRRELQQAVHDLETLREKASPASRPELPEAASESEDASLFQSVAFETNQPVRLPEYARRFSQVLPQIPKPVARAALLLIGRLAAGQPAAFAGLKQLHANKEILRQRVGADYRLLFRLTSDALEVLALVNRRELDRQVRNLFLNP